MASETIKPALEPGKKELKIWHYILALALICAVFYYKIIFGIGHFWEDLIYLEFPHRIFARDTLLSFQFPHWNPNTFSGMPFFASLNTGVLYPFNLVMSLFPVNNATYWYLLQNMIVLHFFFAGVSMFFYMTYKKFTRQASFFAAIGFMFCGFFVTHVVHSMMLNVLVWLPLVVLFLEKGVREDKAHHLVIAGLILGISTLAGHPQITFYEFLFLGSYGLYLWLVKPDRKVMQLLLTALPFVIAVGCALISLLPAMELNNECSRVSWTFEQASEGSIKFVHLITLLMPKVFGAWTGPDSTAPKFWLEGPNYGYYTFWDTCIYVGLAIVILGLIQFKNLRKDPFVLFTVIWLAVTFAIALGSHFFVYKLLFNFAPGFDRFRTPTRITFTWCFLLPVLASMTFEHLKDNDYLEKVKKIFLWVFGIAVVIALATGFGFLENLWPGQLQNAETAGYTAKQGWILIVKLALLGIPLLLVHFKTISTRAARNCIIGALIIDLLIFTSGIHITKNESAARHFGQARDIVKALKKEGENEVFRVNARQFILDDTSTIGRQSGMMILKRNQGMIDKIQITEGFNPLNLYRRIPPLRGRASFDAFLDLLNIKYYVNPDYGRASKAPILLNKDRLPRVKMFYKAKVFKSDSLVKAYMLNNTFDYRNTLLLSQQPEVPLPQDGAFLANQAKITHYSANKITIDVSTEKNGLLWLSDIWYPAWKAWVDGKQVPVMSADYSFRAIEVPEGKHRVTFKYSSSKFTLGMILTLITLLVSAGYLVFYYVKKDQ